MFGFARVKSDVTWKVVEDDFLLGTCSRRVFGFASRGADGTWSAFDDEARPMGAFARLDDVKSMLWRAHRDSHATACVVAREGRPVRKGTTEQPPRRVPEEPSRPAVTHPASW